MNTFYKSFSIALFFIGTVGLAPFSQAEEYNLSYGARLTEANGAPIVGQDGRLDLEVNFYNASSGGSPIGPSLVSFPGTSIAEGVFQLNITLTSTEFHQVFQDPSTPVYIEVKDVKSGATFPRQRFSVIPFALKTPIDNDTIVYSIDGKLTVGSSVGTVKQITAGSGLTGGTIMDSGTITVDTGTTGNKIVQLSDGKLPSVDGSSLSSVNAEKLQTRNVSAAVPVSGQVLKWSGNAWVPSSDLVGETGSGEANTASNVTSGSGVGLFKAKVSADLRFYSLSPGAGVTINLVDDDVVIASTITQYTDAMARAAAVGDAITDAVTDKAPSQNAVFDALALKSEASHNHSGVYEPAGLSTDVVTTTKILNGAVTTDKITDANVTSAKIASGVDATKIGSGAIDNTEFSYLNGVTSAIQTQLDGKVVGPASATDNAVARFDGTTGKFVQNSGVVIDDSGKVGIGTTNPTALLQLGNNIVTDVPADTALFIEGPKSLRFGSSNGNPNYGSYFIPNYALPNESSLTIGIRANGGTNWDMLSLSKQGVGVGGVQSTGGRMLYVKPSIWSGTEMSVVRSGFDYIGAGFFPTVYGVYVETPTGNITTKYAIVTEVNAGNVGIGTTSPQQKLSVAGTIESTSGGFKFPDGSIQYTATKFVNRVYAENASYLSITTMIPLDDTIPQVSEGTQILSASITPTNSSSRLRIHVAAPFNLGNNSTGVVALFRDGGTDALCANTNAPSATNSDQDLTLTHEVVAGSTSTTTFSVRVGSTGSSLYLNGRTTGRVLGGVQKAVITIDELTP